VVAESGADPTEDLPIPVFHSGGRVCAGLADAVKGVHTAIIVTTEVPSDMLADIVDHRKIEFMHVVLVSKLNQMGTIAVTPYDIGGLLGLDVGQSLLDPWQRAFKRLVDIGLVLFGGLVISPVLLLVALLVRLTSPGSIFYAQERIGEGGRRFKVWKYRTMTQDADKALATYLKNHPELQAEWEASFKLKDDPRITPIGGFLRKFSVDELPQLWNVLKGEMSLVGPRPIVDAEVGRYNGTFHLYTRVKPGITGMWQVSGRSDIRYGDRVRLDEYYVRNWSFWLDIYILARTVGTVLSRRGAC
jgi:Undecaprenyl-phosphate galactose phosphotransferase WbaP